MGYIETRRDITSGLTISVARGDFISGDLLDWVNDYFSGDITQFILWDFTEANITKIPLKEFKIIAHEVKTRSCAMMGGKTALVFRGDVGYGIGRMFEAFTEFEGVKSEYRSFRNTREAKEWLGV